MSQAETGGPTKDGSTQAVEMKVKTLGPLRGPERLGDRHEHRRVQHAAAEALDEASRDQLDHRLGRARDDEPDDEDAEAHQERAGRPIRSHTRPARTVASSMPMTKSEKAHA